MLVHAVNGSRSQTITIHVHGLMFDVINIDVAYIDEAYIDVTHSKVSVEKIFGKRYYD